MSNGWNRLLLLICLSLFPQTGNTDQADLQSFAVNRVIDGDTIELTVKDKLIKVRLIGVNTPETVDPSKPVEHFGSEATAFTKWLLTGQNVYLDFDQDRQDRYDRLLAYVYRASDGLFVNAEIIRQGYGRAYTVATVVTVVTGVTGVTRN